MSKTLFEDFQSVSAKEWKQRIQVELKGADFNEKLVTKTWEGIDIKPFYHKDETEPVSQAIPSNSWLVSERIAFASTEETLATILDDVSRGAESIWLEVAQPSASFLELLKDDTLPQVPFFIELKFLDASFNSDLLQLIKEKKLQASLGIDIYGNLAATGNWFNNQKTDVQEFTNLVEQAQNIPFLMIDARPYQEAGGNQTQQIAYALAHLNEYLNTLQQPEKISQISLVVSIGSNYFFEIAKLKAMRWCINSLLEDAKLPAQVKIMAIPSKRNKSLYDYNVNMLRTATEIMSAVLGGADEVANLAYDHLYHHSNEFGKRIARNQLLLLKNEAHFDKVNNPTDGAYYIENLVHQLANNALSLFKQIEAGGGFLQQLFDGKIQEKLKESAVKEKALFDEGKRVLVGTNKYPNAEDKMKESLQKDPFLAKEKRKTLLQPIVERRLASAVEKARLKEEASAQ